MKWTAVWVGCIPLYNKNIQVVNNDNYTMSWKAVLVSWYLSVWEKLVDHSAGGHLIKLNSLYHVSYSSIVLAGAFQWMFDSSCQL